MSYISSQKAAGMIGVVLKWAFFLSEVFFEEGLEDRDDKSIYGRVIIINTTRQP